MAASSGRFAVCSPHELASEAGAQVLREGGNALDAAIAVNLALAVLTPYCCGPGGDLFALVWDGAARGVMSAGRSPAALEIDLLRRTGATAMPLLGPHSVTVPGAIPGWFSLLERYGSRSFAELAAPAIRLARDGFDLSARGAGFFIDLRPLYRDFPEHAALYGDVTPGRHLRQPALAEALELLAADGPAAYSNGAIGEAVVASVQRHGGVLELGDLAGHEVEWVEPLRARYRDVEVLELPPPTQGVTALELLRILDGFDVTADELTRLHRQIEATKLALADRDEHLGDPATMTLEPAQLLDEDYVATRRSRIDPQRASRPEGGRPQRGGTAAFCTADANGMIVSMIQSNFLAFGSGLTVPDFGFGLHNRGSSFSLDPHHPNRLGPARRPLHTLIPALALDHGAPCLAFGAMGGDGQAQTHAQVLARFVDEAEDPQTAVDAARFKVDPGTWTVHIEARVGSTVIDGLRRFGHDVRVAADHDDAMGHAHAIEVLDGDGYRAGSDARTEGRAITR